MYTIVGINTVNYGSTGIIMLEIGGLAQNKGFIFYPSFMNSKSNKRKKVTNALIIGTRIGHYIHSKYAYITGIQGSGSRLDTLIFLHKLKKIKPDIIHIHNLHDNYINLSMLFSYIKRNNIQVIWTLHDCWSFTGQCPYFTIVDCNKWKTGCHECIQYNRYPSARVDNTFKMWQLKRRWFSEIPNLIIVTPSQWLAEMVKKSYLKEYPIKVINNGINIEQFKDIKSNFRKNYSIEEKYIVLGVAFDWGKRKGLDVFVKLSQVLDYNYKIVLVGTDEEVDKAIPDNILSIHRTHNQKELAEIYSAADVFANPTREDNFPTVNMEAIACGTPVVTFETGGSPEIIDNTCGSVVLCDDMEGFEREIIRVCEERPYSKEACRKRAVDMFNKEKRFDDYIELYDSVLEIGYKKEY